MTAQGVTLTVQMATDFSMASLLKTIGSSSKNRSSWDFQTPSLQHRTRRPEPDGHRANLRSSQIDRLETGSPGRSETLLQCFIYFCDWELQGRSRQWMDSSKLRSGILGALESDSREITLKSHTLEHRSHQSQNKINIFCIHTFYLMHNLL